MEIINSGTVSRPNFTRNTGEQQRVLNPPEVDNNPKSYLSVIVEDYCPNFYIIGRRLLSALHTRWSREEYVKLRRPSGSWEVDGFE